MSELKISLLNHASIVVTFEEIKLLIDPWFEGSCFEDGWGLRHNNPHAYEEAKTCTHLWISHFHSDHFHIPTLQKIISIHPHIKIFGNHSFNFQLDNALRKLGFQSVISFHEKKRISLSDKFSIERIPTTGIDNMLVIRTSEGNILNYNDCNIPVRTRKLISNNIGAIDLILNNFNHAGKLVEYPAQGANAVKDAHRTNFRRNFESFNPRYVFPFASYHYYKAPESQAQNNSMLDLPDLLSLDNRIIPAHIGDTVTFFNKFNTYAVNRTFDVKTNELLLHKQEKSYSFDELKLASATYRTKLKSGFLWLTRLLPDLNIYVSDLKCNIRLDSKLGLTKSNDNALPHIVSSSESIYKWFEKPYGTDSFVVGAHFEITQTAIPLKWQILMALMIENRVDFVSLIKMLFTPSGIQFLWNRKDEIISILLNRQISSSSQRN